MSAGGGGPFHRVRNICSERWWRQSHGHRPGSLNPNFFPPSFHRDIEFFCLLPWRKSPYESKVSIWMDSKNRSQSLSIKRLTSSCCRQWSGSRARVRDVAATMADHCALRPLSFVNRPAFVAMTSPATTPSLIRAMSQLFRWHHDLIVRCSTDGKTRCWMTATFATDGATQLERCRRNKVWHYPAAASPTPVRRANPSEA